MKTTADTTLLTAIRAVAEGKTFISPEVRKLMTNDPPIPRLSDRQRDVLQSLTQGLTNKEIAQRFGLCAELARRLKGEPTPQTPRPAPEGEPSEARVPRLPCNRP